MSRSDTDMIELIAREVIAVLRRRGVGYQSTGTGGTGGTGGTTGGGGRAAIRPPVGTCTGDYSKFRELQGKFTDEPVTAASQQVALSGIITARQLTDAIDASPGGVALLAPDARLTPLANDFVRQYPDKISRAAAIPLTQVAADSQAVPWLWWIDGQCSVAQQITTQHAAGLSRITASNLLQVVRSLSTSIKSHRAAGGVLFVPSAARVMCYANRCASIRAVVGTCGEAVEQGINELGANVLVIEYPHIGPRAMTAMVERMLNHQPRTPAAVERELADLHRC